MRPLKMTLAAALVLAAGASVAATENVTLFRVFLNDGTAVVSYGEYARVGDRVVFSMPIGVVNPESDAEPALHVVNIPATAVDWSKTARYTDAARYAHYAATNGESDYAALTGEVAAVLNEARLIKDPLQRLNTVLQARRRLASWPREHLGYRTADVREVIGLLDEVISEMRASAGQTSFSLELIAATPAPEPAPMLRAPTAAESIAQALAVAKVTDVAADRVALLHAVVSAIDDSRNSVPDKWAGTTRRWAVWMLGQEEWTDKLYARLVASTVQRARLAAANADVNGVQGVLESAQRRDKDLGRHRPDVVAAMLDEVRVQLDSARRLRLARDRWKERVGSFRAYQASIAPVVLTLQGAQRHLEDIKTLAGSEPQDLVTLADRLADGSRRLQNVAVPDELKPAHALLQSAINLADQAVKARHQAVLSADLKSAWDASSAAAGSMMLFTRAQEDMEAIVKLPQTR